jgi:hypothetical protein
MEKRIRNISREDRHEQQIIGKISLDVTGGAKLGDEKPFLCNMINMSLSGALVETGTPLTVGKLMNYSFRIPGVSSTVNVLAEVVRLDGMDHEEKTERKREKLKVYGIRFLDLNNMDRSNIQGFLNT